MTDPRTRRTPEEIRRRCIQCGRPTATMTKWGNRWCGRCFEVCKREIRDNRRHNAYR